MISTAKNGGVEIPVGEHWKPDVSSGSRRAIADADVRGRQFKSSAEDALQNLGIGKCSASVVNMLKCVLDLKRSDVGID